jgi:hypothetical protein
MTSHGVTGQLFARGVNVGGDMEYIRHMLPSSKPIFHVATKVRHYGAGRED